MNEQRAEAGLTGRVTDAENQGAKRVAPVRGVKMARRDSATFANAISRCPHLKDGCYPGKPEKLKVRESERHTDLQRPVNE